MATNKLQTANLPNNMGTSVNLASYTSTFYTFPTDGYVMVNAGAASTSKAIVRIYPANESTNISIGGWNTGNYPSWATFVRKGMKAKVATLENQGTIYFYPLIY
jgi:hypothetical protein